MSALSKQFTFIINTGSSTATSVAIPSAAVAQDGSSVFKSIPQRGAGYYGNSGGMHTVTYTVTPGFVGTLTTQATLSVSPVETDWFDVSQTTVIYDSLVNQVATTTTNYVNFAGNFVWCRAYVQRGVVSLPGSVMFINYNT